jgi:phosphohistidine phosphatase
MRVILIRHGDAVASSLLGDSGRHLSVEGRRQATATGRALAEHQVRPSRVWCSPLVRAVQTAELVIAPLEFAGVVEARDDLYPDSSVDSLAQALAEMSDEESLIVVGHQPYMSTAVSLLLERPIASFPTGAAYCLQVAGLFPHRVTLEWRWPD